MKGVWERDRVIWNYFKCNVSFWWKGGGIVILEFIIIGKFLKEMIKEGK